MGLTDDFKPSRSEVEQTRSALAEAEAGERNGGAIERLVRLIMELGIDGKGPLRSSRQLADKALAEHDGDRERAIRDVTGSAVRWGTVGGFVTGLGGFVTMPVALPANLLEFYVQATRMVAAVAHLRGYDVEDPRIRTAVMLTMVGSDADDVLKKAGITTVSGRVASFALRRLPASAMMMVNKAIGFRLLRGVAEKSLSRLGRGVPFVGGVLGGGVDLFMMRMIAKNAREQFPAT